MEEYVLFFLEHLHNFKFPNLKANFVGALWYHSI